MKTFLLSAVLAVAFMAAPLLLRPPWSKRCR